ncbi:MAG: aminoacyl-tRNA hydrolase [Proteobacteria bacterium CG1_02_64_396]|nr:MAG: aminoacyl-tRNA hydrolase [Proteobacteria bacterium CG1_02_64_396]
MPGTLIVGLGNPGTQYEGSRHNVGFLFVERMADLWGLPPFKKGLHQAQSARGRVEGESVALALPQTFMNRSGDTVVPFLNDLGIEGDRMLVVHDDMDLPLGHLRLKVGGGHGGHNGLRHIMARLGHGDFARLRVGIGKAASREETVNFVLGRFGKAEQALIDDAFDALRPHFKLLVHAEWNLAMNHINLIKPATT